MVVFGVVIVLANWATTYFYLMGEHTSWRSIGLPSGRARVDPR